MENLLTKGAVAGKLGCGIGKVNRLIYSGKLVPVRLGHRTVRFREADVEAAVEALRSSKEVPGKH